MVLALAATLGLLSSLIGIQHSPDIQSSGQQHAVIAAPSLFEAPAADVRQATTIDWRSCLTPDDANSPMAKQEFLQQIPARLRLEHIRFTHLRSMAGITLIVAYDIARLHMLDGLCASWGGHISAAVYQGYESNGTAAAHAAALQIDDIWNRVTAARTCALDIALYSESLAMGDPWMAWLFPVNSLRSRALLLARTPLVLVLDGDMLVHSKLHAQLASDTQRYRRLLDSAAQRTYHVLAALETPDTEVAYSTAYGTKAGCVQRMSSGEVTRFNPKHDYPQGCTDYDRWKRAQEPYSITYCRRYEPWGIADRRHMPWFDVRFRGYGRNKIVFTAALNASSFAFEVDDASFVIHRPHEASSGSFAFSSDAALQGHIVGMYTEQAKKGVFTQVLDDTVTRCRSMLPWWQ